MPTGDISDNQQVNPSRKVGDDEMISPALVREELTRIFTSRHFRASRRSKEFLQYVVNQKLSGNGELLKERLIGVKIFGRKPDYSAGEDPVVRVLAGDVRHRLERYHTDPECRSDILIEIPLGSYAPVFRLSKESQAYNPSTGEITKRDRTEAHSLGVSTPFEADLHESNIDGRYGAAQPDTEQRPGSVSFAVQIPRSRDQRAGPQLDSDAAVAAKGTNVKPTVIPVLACLTLIGYFVFSYFHRPTDPTLRAFWLPAYASSRPVLLCLPRPMVYTPSERLFEKYRKSHPNALVTREARRDEVLPLEPTDTIQWGDMVPSHNSGPGVGGVIAAVNISRLLAEQGIRFNLRFGKEATYAEMRDSPVVIVGGINTDWTTQLTSGLHFVFDETRAAPNIHETIGAKRVWKMETNDGQITRDYGLITRQVSGIAGQFLVQVAGVSQFGTEAASEFLANQQEFAALLHSDSIGLQKKNLQIVVSTDVTDGRAGPPHVVAVSSW